MYTYDFIQKNILHFLDYDFFNDGVLRRTILFICKSINSYKIKINLRVVLRYKNNLIFKLIFKKPLIFLYFVKIVILKKIKKFLNSFLSKQKLINKKFDIEFDLPYHMIRNMSLHNHRIGRLVKCNGFVVKKDKTNIFIEQNIFFNEYLYLIYENNATGVLNSLSFLKFHHNFYNTNNDTGFGFSKFKNCNLLKIITNCFSRSFYCINLFVSEYFYNHIIPGDFVVCGGVFFIFFLKHLSEIKLNVNICMMSTSCHLRNKKLHKIGFFFQELFFNIELNKFLNTYESLERNYLITSYFPITFKKIFFLMITEVNKNKNSYDTYKIKNLSFLFIYNKNFLKKQLSNICNYLCNDCITIGNFSWITLFNYEMKLQIQSL